MAEAGRRAVLHPDRVDTSVEHQGRIEDGDRLAIVASYGPGPRVSRSLHALVERLHDSGYPAVVVRASDDPRPLEWPGALPPDVVVLRKPNIGYDFGSWAVGMARYRPLLARPYVLLANDSMVGPFASLGTLLGDFETTCADFWGATSTEQFEHHIQSYFMGFRGGVLLDPALRRFWTHLPIEQDKARIIMRYEVGLSRLLFSEAYAAIAHFEAETIVQVHDNPVILGWRALLERGFPFVKRELLRSPDIVPDGDDIPGTVTEMFGADPSDWI